MVASPALSACITCLTPCRLAGAVRPLPRTRPACITLSSSALLGGLYIAVSAKGRRSLM